MALILAVNCAFAGEEGYAAIIKKQSAQIKSLQSRLDHLEQTVAAMQVKQPNSEPKPNLDKQTTQSQEAHSPLAQGKKLKILQKKKKIQPER